MEYTVYESTPTPTQALSFEMYMPWMNAVNEPFTDKNSVFFIKLNNTSIVPARHC